MAVEDLAYQRHGAKIRIAAIQVATGTVSGWVGQGRAEEDFTRVIERVVQGNPGDLR